MCHEAELTKEYRLRASRDVFMIQRKQSGHELEKSIAQATSASTL